ncbi:MAG: phosphatidate cytidylyltransferase [Flavobacteriales bacterium]|nr:phosphatidate cytidylyltransferase [Flavobacteriales bacterium]
MNEVAVRAMTGFVYVALTIGAALAGPFTTALLFFPICLLAADEMHKLLWAEGESYPPFWSVLIAGAMYVAMALGHFEPFWEWTYTAGLAILLLSISLIWVMLRGFTNPSNLLGGSFIIILLVALPFGSLPYLFKHGSWMFIAFMIMLWTNDTGAYLIGRAIGRTKLMPTVSPKKTVEGFLGGFVLTMVASYIISYYDDTISMTHWLMVGALTSLTSTVGRSDRIRLQTCTWVKDAGNLLPGHGGILDRFDGFLVAVPAVVIYLNWIFEVT